MFRKGISKCPTSSLELESFAEDLKCPDKTFYHCLKDQHGVLGEICVRPSWIPSGYCPEYNRAAVRVDAEKCDKSLGLCPGKTYLSSEGLSYSACLKTPDNNEAPWPFSNKGEKVTPQIYKSNANVTKGDLESAHATPFSSEKWLTALYIVIPVSILLISAALFFYIRRRKRQRMSTLYKDLCDYAGQQPQDIADDQHNQDDSTIPEEHIPMVLNEVSDEIDKEGIVSERGILSIHDNQFFCETTVYQRMKIILEEGKSAVIVGQHGIGKTATCLKLYNTFQNRVISGNKFECSIIHDFESFDVFSKTLNNSNRHIVFLDELFSAWKYRKGLGGLCCLYIRRINSLMEKTGRLQMILTIESETINMHKEDFRTLKILENMIDFSSGEHRLSSSERESILKLQLKRYTFEIADLPEKETFSVEDMNVKKNVISEGTFNRILTQSIVEEERACGFPLSCELFCRNKNLSKYKNEFFALPKWKCQEDIQRIRTSSDQIERLQYIMLLYIVLKGNFSPSSIDNDLVECLEREIAQTLEANVELEKACKETEIHDWLSICRKSSYVVEINDGNFTFCHEFVSELVLLDFGIWNRDLLLRLYKNNNDAILKYIYLENR